MSEEENKQVVLGPLQHQSTGPSIEKHLPNFKQVELQRQQMSLLFRPPASGSFPFHISWDDVKKVLITLAYVAASAVVTYLLQVFIPGLHTDNPIVILLLPIVTGVLQTVDRWLRDTRPPEEQKVLPYRLYKERVRALAQQQVAGLNMDPHKPQK